MRVSTTAVYFSVGSLCSRRSVGLRFVAVAGEERARPSIEDDDRGESDERAEGNRGWPDPGECRREPDPDRTGQHAEHAQREKDGAEEGRPSRATVERFDPAELQGS